MSAHSSLPGLHLNLSRLGTRLTASVPGTGLSLIDRRSWHRLAAAGGEDIPPEVLRRAEQARRDAARAAGVPLSAVEVSIEHEQREGDGAPVIEVTAPVIRRAAPKRHRIVEVLAYTSLALTWLAALLIGAVVLGGVLFVVVSVIRG